MRAHRLEEEAMASLQSVSDDEIVSNLTREKADLTQQVVQLSEEVKRATQASEKAEAALTKKASETKSLAMRIAILETVLEAANVELPRPMPVEKKGSGKMMTMLQNATSAKAKEDGGHDGDAQRTSPSGRSAIKPSSNASSSRASPNVGSRSLANRSPGSFTRGSPSVGSPGRGRSRPRSPTLSLVASEPDSSAGANPNAALNPSSSRRTAPKDVIGGGDSASSTWPGAIHVGGSGGGDESVARVFATCVMTWVSSSHRSPRLHCPPWPPLPASRLDFPSAFHPSQSHCLRARDHQGRHTWLGQHRGYEAPQCAH